jgi:hypothetical protein
MSGVEERFLKLPDSEDYTRVRQFKIDAKGAVVSRGNYFINYNAKTVLIFVGDSFRRKRVSSQNNSLSAASRKSEFYQ